jgi:predicted alpha/beta hydrolase
MAVGMVNKEEWVSDWRQFCNFSAISWREQVNFQWDDDDDEGRFVLDQHAELDFYSASSLKQQSTSRHVAPLGHIILIPSQPVVALSP